MDKVTLDLTALRRLLAAIGGDAGDFAELVDDYAAGAPALVATIGDAASSMEWESVFRSAHTLKSNAKNFGAQRLAALCADLETAARQGQVAQLEALITEIGTEEIKAREALQSISVDDLTD